MIYTTGYAGRTLEGLRALVHETAAILVDVRFSPRSRQPMWTRAALAKALGDHYVHVPTLGNRNYKGGPVDIVNLDAGIATVRQLLTQAQAVILLCVCAEVQACHRLPVATALGQALDEQIRHVRVPDVIPQMPLPLL